jgi:hypothetical protein
MILSEAVKLMKIQSKNTHLKLLSKSPNGYKTHEKMLTILAHKGNANQNYIKIPPHSC